MSPRVPLLLAGLGAVLAALALLAAPADADPTGQYTEANKSSICTYLDAYPSFPGVDAVFDGIRRDTGLGMRETARVLVAVVNTSCPWHMMLLATYAGAGSPQPPMVVV